MADRDPSDLPIQPDGTVVFRRSRRHMAILGVGAAAGLAICLHRVLHLGETGLWPDRILAAVFTAMLIYALWRILASPALLIIGPRGIEHRMTRLGCIPWAEIREVRVQMLRNAAFLCVLPNDERNVLARDPAFARTVARVKEIWDIQGIPLPLAVLGADRRNVMAAVRHFGGGSNAPIDA